MMKKYLIILLIYSTQIYAQSVGGEMDCTVTGNVVVATEEGKFKTYSGIEGGVEANEKLTFSYDVTNNSIFMGLKRNNSKKDTVINAYYYSKDSKTKIEKYKDGGFVVTEKDYNHSISFLPDYIRINGFRELFLKRYYKNDWHGIYSNVDNTSSSTHTMTFNCRHTFDNMDEAFKKFTDIKMSK
jgi:hypothetical protein